jgi:competence protein ComEC
VTGTRDLRAPALGLAAWAGALLALVLPGWVAVAVLLAGGAALVRSPAAWRATVACWLLVGAAVWTSAVVRETATGDGPVADLADRRTAVTVRLVVTSDPVRLHGRWADGFRLRADVHEVSSYAGSARLRAPVLVLAGEEWSAVRLGSTVRAAGRLDAAEDGALAAVLHVRGPPQVLEEPGPLWRASGAVRTAVREAAAPGPRPARDLVPALVMGDESGLTEDLRTDFRTTGLTHLLAVSGTNLTLVVGFLVLLGRWCGVRAHGLTVLAVVGIVGFVLVARTEPSVVRAAAMGAVALLGLGAGAGDRGPRALGMAVALLLLWDPWWAVSVGFTLSVLATAGILFLVPPWRDALASWMPSWLATALAVPAAAQLVCTPVIAAISGEISLVAVLANLLAGPLVAPATILGLAGGLAGLLHDEVGPLLAVPGTWAGSGIVAVATHAARLSTPSVAWGTGALAITVLVLGCCAAAAVAPRLLRLPVPTGCACLVVGLAVLLGPPSPGWPPAGWVLAACDVGQGDAIAVRVGEGAALVVDAGPDPRLVDRCLDRLEVDRVPLVLLTHFHADHVDGLPGVMAGREVGAVESAAPEAGDRLGPVADTGSGMPRVPEYGETRRLGEATLQVVGPLPGAHHDGPNNASVVLLVEVRGVRILLSGDVEPEAQADLAESLPGLRVDVLKVPHHGSRHQDMDWLASLGARVAIASVGADNDYGHPAPETVRVLAEAGARVLRTDRDGDVVVVATDEGLAVRTGG